jgi:hypothetical protein
MKSVDLKQAQLTSKDVHCEILFKSVQQSCEIAKINYFYLSSIQQELRA